MLTQQLSTNDDLVETLETEPVFDYLVQHGVLNTDVVDGICNVETKLGRNSALLQHLDDNGDTAKALFINALRQSGQHKLASTIDTSQRIKPVYGTGYWDKPRHKGEVKIKICIKALKLLVPKTDSPTNEKRQCCVASATPQRLHKSYENMLDVMDDNSHKLKSHPISEYAYDKEEEEEEEEKPIKKSCWCMCFPMFCRPKHKKEKKYVKKIENKKIDKNKTKKQQFEHPESRRMLEFNEKLPEKRKPRNVNKERQSRSTNLKSELPLSSLTYDQRRNSGSPRKETDIVGYKNNRNDSKVLRTVHDKENMVPIIMQYDNQNETVELRRVREDKNSPLRANQTPKKTNTNNNGTVLNVEMCEKWKTDGKIFDEKLTEFCALFELKAMQDSVTKYFEQNRGTLFFQSGSDGSSVFICNICMSRKQVEVLKAEYENGTIQSDLQKIILDNDMRVQLDIPGLEISTIIDEDQFVNALEELT